LFDDLSRPTVLAFMAQWADPRDSRALSLSRLIRWLRQQRYAQADAAAPMHALLQAPHLEATRGKAWVQVRWVRALVTPSQAVHTHRAEIRSQIAEFFGAHANQDLWTRVTERWPLLGAHLVAASSVDRERFASAEVGQALAGTWPVAYQRG
jgi:hypothetical protein